MEHDGGSRQKSPQIEGTFSRSRRLGLLSCSPYLSLLRHGLEVDILRPVYTGPGAQDLGLEKRPDKPLKGQAVVAEKAGHSDGGGCQDAQPTGGLLAHNAFEHEVNPNRRAHGQGGTEKLPGGQAEKDRLPVLVDFLWNFDLHIAITSKMDFLTRFLKYEIIFAEKTIYFKTNRGGFFMFRNLTLAQQMFFFVLAVFLILLVFRILVKLKLAPVLVYAACANLIFPEWVAEQKALYWTVLAGLVLVTIFRWVGPRLTAHMEEQRIMREIVEQSRAAEAMGYRNDQISFEVKNGTPQIKIRQ